MPPAPSDPVSNRYTRLTLFTVAALALHQAMRVELGQYHPRAMVWLTVAVVACWVAVVSPGIAFLEVRGRRLFFQVLCGGLAIQFLQAMKLPPGFVPPGGSSSVPPVFLGGVVVAAALVFWAVRRPEGGAHRWFLALALVHFALGVWFLRTSPPVDIDVLKFQNESADALLRGINPYTITFADPSGGTSAFYGPGVSVNGRLLFGFPYPPLDLLFCVPARAFFGDVRFAHLLCVTLAGLFIGYSTSGLVSRLAAAFFWFAPCTYFVIQMSWTESFGVLLLSLTVFLTGRQSRGTAAVFGLLLAVKQYMIFAPFAIWSLLRGQSRQQIVHFCSIAAGVAAAVTLPLALWNWQAFFHSVVTLQMFQPFREDALSYLAWLVHMGFGQPPQWFPFLPALVAAWITVKRGGTSASSFAGGMALIYITFFCFSKQAFCNYYFLVSGALCAAIAAGSGRASEDEHAPGAER
ncbi:hypothetical protein [uncultured Paludibaculum sp.]|uniref:hypothetical protein n=1 Tax=uncultured Paludibaculum sp. TaxID=1765020 RepID=UPI002AAB1A8F|nr:hypothetical protein [uncultured Paludibaculum sp.]